MQTEKLILPEFVFGEFPIKTGGLNDQRQFIFHKGISLIEIISHEEITAITFDNKVSKQFSFFGEDFTLVYHTNNSNLHKIDEMTLLDNAWEWYREYLIWEDNQEH